MHTLTDPERDLSATLAAAWKNGRIPVPATALIPPNARSAHLVQHRVLSLLGEPIAGFKVGAKAHDGPGQCAPLPRGAMHASPGSVRLSDHPVLGLELELAFRLNRRFEPSTRPHDEAVVMNSIASVCATIEIVESRYEGWPQIDRLLQLADLQNHGALIVGNAVPYDPSFPFTSPNVRFEFDSEVIAEGPAANPAGDPRRLITHVVSHCTGYGFAITPDHVITAGSYTGMYFPKRAGIATGRIEGLPGVSVTIA